MKPFLRKTLSIARVAPPCRILCKIRSQAPPSHFAGGRYRGTRRRGRGTNCVEQLQGHHEPARDRFRDAGEPAGPRARSGSRSGRRCDIYRARAGEEQATASPSCCTTARLMPTAPSTSATPSTRSSRTSSNKAHAQRGYFTPYVPGWDCHGQPIEHMVERDARAREDGARSPRPTLRQPLPRVGGEVRRRAARAASSASA